MAIADNIDIDFTNRIVDVTGVDALAPWDVLNVYSYLKEQFKLSPNADDDFALDAPTPFDLTLKNNWYLRRHSLPRITGGSVTANYGTDQIEKLAFAAGGYTNVVESDIGKVVAGTGLDADDVLIDFDNNRRVWWVRTGDTTTVSDSTAITITGGTGAGTTAGGSVDCVTDQWTGVKTIGDLVTTGPGPLIYIFVGDTTTGDFLGTARRVEGVADDALHFEDDFNEELINGDRGALDSVLINIIDAGTTLGNPSGEIRAYARTGLDTYSDFSISITAGGLISIPVSNAPDGQDTLGEYAVAVDGIASGPFTVAETIEENSGGTPNWRAEVVEVIGTQAATRVLILRSLTGAITDNDTFVGNSSSATGVIRGTTGSSIITYDVETDGIIEGEYGNLLTGGTSTATSNLRGHLTIAEGDTTNGHAIVEVRHDNEAFATDYIDFVSEGVTGTGVDVTADITGRAFDRLASGLDDIRIKAVVFDLTVADSSGFVVGADCTQTVTGAKGTVISVPDSTSIFVSQNNTTEWTGANVIDDDNGAATETITGAVRDHTFDFALSLQSAFPYDIMIEAAGRTAAELFHYAKFFQEARATAAFTDLNGSNADPDNDREFNMIKERAGGSTLDLTTVQGEEYVRAFTDDDATNSYSNQDQKSRLVVSNGGALVTGQGVAIINIASADANNFTLIDSDNVTHIPNVSVTVSITNCVTASGGAHLHVALDNGSGQEDKLQFNVAAAGNTAGDADLVIDEVLPNDTPTTGTVKVVDTSGTQTENRELRYRYSSYVTSTFTLTSGAGTGTETTGDATGTTLTDSAADFGGADSVIVGDPIRNSTTSDIAWVKEIISTTQLATTALTGGGDNEWGSGDGYDINVLAFTHDGTETAYVPYLDIICDTATETVNLTFVSNRNIVLVHRHVDFLDVASLGTITNTGFSFRISQTTDPRYTAT